MKKLTVKIAIAMFALAVPLALLNPTNAQSTTKCSVGAAVNANTASDAVLLKLPGVGQRILGEIKDYRPYKNIAHFRKEIGKYLKPAALNKLAVCIYVK